MKIKFIPHKPYPEFEIFDDNKIVIHLKIDPEIQVFRIKCLDNRRVFFITDKLVKKNKITILLNEYSQQLGSLVRSKANDNTGEIEIEGIQYMYKLNDDFSKEINLFQPGNYQPILSCKLELGQLSFLNDDYIHYILFSLAWFKFLTRLQPTLSQFAEAQISKMASVDFGKHFF